MPLASLAGPPTISAHLGPTNTGKTHRAIRRMLGHRSGMIGLPLRLLAREVYDRVTAEVGEQQVALVTGEERRVPDKPRYWVCTTEAMPLHRTVDFLAVDEVQMATHPERGHVFTDRILHARGAAETWLLGADTILPLLRELIPTIEVHRHPRLSRLSYAGHKRLSALPPRSAVVAFSVAHVYELAERLRRIHGGTALVLGALSPRTRNAQVALYQAGEVPVMVATDAIGMGLNLDIHHVALASRHKYDGREHRELYADELAQIAGRAGRYKRDGTFGPTARAEELPPELSEALEQHLFPPLSQLWYRNTDLDFGSVGALQDSLAARPPRAFLQRLRRADDTDALDHLARHEEIRPRLLGPDRVRLLWEVCQIPDFRKTMVEAHAALLRTLFLQLTGPKGRLDPDFLDARLRRLDRVDGEVELLMTRIAFVRTWTYVSHRAAWLDDPAHWQARSRDLEDRLSDALHEQLTRRFVDKRTMVLVQRLDGGELEATVAADGQVEAAGQELGRLVGLDFLVTPGTSPEAEKAARRAAHTGLGPELARRVQALVEADHSELSVAERGLVLWQGAPVGRLTPGPDILSPQVRVQSFALLGAGDRARIERRLQAFARDLVELVVGGLREPENSKLSPPARGLVYALERSMGVLPRAQVAEQLAGLSGADRQRLGALDVRLGRATVYQAGRFTPAHLEARRALWVAFAGAPELPPLARDAPASFPLTPEIPASYRRALGYLALGPRAVRVDQAERVAARLRKAARKGPFTLPEELMSWLGARPEDMPGVVAAFGYRPLPTAAEAPLRWVSLDAEAGRRDPRERRSAQRAGERRRARSERGPRRPWRPPGHLGQD